MSTYTAPLKDMQFVLHELAGLDAIARLPGYGDVIARPRRLRCSKALPPSPARSGGR
jgi:hypothetical protein